MKITQRIIAMLLVLVMTWSAFPVTALTATKDMIAGYVTQEDPASTDATDPEETDPSTLPEGSETTEATETENTEMTTAPVTEPEETQPVTTPEETESTDVTVPDETVPDETESTVADPTVPETEPTVTEPEETVPDETTPSETVPDVTEPEETVPEETEPEVEPVPEWDAQENDPTETVTATIFTFNEDGTVDPLQISVQKNAMGGISTMALPTESSKATHYIRVKVVRNNSESPFNFTFKGKTYNNNALYDHGVLIDGTLYNAYCIDPGVAVDQATGGYSGTENAWDNLDENTQFAIGLVLLYGAPNGSIGTSTKDKAFYELATQAIITEIMLGYRKNTAPFTCTNSRLVNFWANKADGSANPTRTFVAGEKSEYHSLNGEKYDLDDQERFRHAYNMLSLRLANHYTVPSFASTATAQAKTYTMTLQSDGTYAVTLTDTNGILSQCTFKNGNGLTYKVSGNKLTITASAAFTGTKSCGYTSSKGGGYKSTPSLTSSAFILWSSGNLQRLVSLAESQNDPVPFYFNVKVETGSAQVQKRIEGGNLDGSVLSGWQFTLYSDAACTQKIETKIADANGRVLFTNLVHGTTYYIKETGDIKGRYNSEYWVIDKSVKSFTAVAGKTVTVEFENNLLGKVKIQKKTSDGKDLGGWKFDIYRTEVQNAVDDPVYIGTLTTDDNGISVSEAMTPGWYYAVEQPIDSEDWAPNTANHFFTVTGGKTVEIEVYNSRKGVVKIIKTTNTQDDHPEDVQGWLFELSIYTGYVYRTIGTYETDENGEIQITGLKPGTYNIKEKGRADGSSTEYWTSFSETFTLEENEEKIIEVKNYYGGTVRIEKRTNTREDLDGWTIAIWRIEDDGSRTYVDTYTTDTTGFVTSDALSPGNYVAKETGTSRANRDLAYWLIDPNEVFFTIEEGKTSYIGFSNEYYLGGYIRIWKWTNSDYQEDADGWVFGLYDENGGLVGTGTTVQGEVQFGPLRPGTYYVEEIGDEQGRFSDAHWQCDTTSYQVDVTLNNTTLVEVYNIYSGSLAVRKYTADGSNLAGWIFGVYADPSCKEGDELLTLTTDNTGLAVCMEELAPGEYYIKEIKHNSIYLGYWAIDKTVWKATISETGTTYSIYTDGNVWPDDMSRPNNCAAFYNTQRPEVWITKTFADDTGGSLAGFKFELYQGKSVDPDKLLATFESRDWGGAEWTWIADSDVIIDTYYDSVALNPGYYTIREVLDEDSIYECSSENPLTVYIDSGKQYEFVFENSYKDGTAKIVKKLAPGTTGSLDGWTFNLYIGDVYPGDPDAADYLIGTYTTDSEGVISVDLRPGEYTVAEVLPDDSKYQAVGSYYEVFEVEANTEAVCEFINGYKNGKVQIAKTFADGVTGSLEGWTFEIYYGTEIDPDMLEDVYVTNADGIITTELAPGTYTIREIADPDGNYVCASENPQTVTIEPNETAVVAFENTYANGSLTIVKTLAEGSAGTLGGWTFEIYKGSEVNEEMLLDTVVTGEDGTIAIDLFPGTYTVFEVLPADGEYYSTSANPQVIEVTPGDAVSVAYENAQYPGNLKISKYLPNDPDGSLAGWTFEVYKGNAVLPGALIATLVTDANGEAELNDLMPGEYTIRELLPDGSEYYCSTANPITVNVVGNVTLEVAFENLLYPGSLTIRKVFANGTTGSLAGWSFDVYEGTDLNADNFLFTAVTDEEGYFNTSLSVGTYTIVEQLSADSEYVATAARQVVTIEPNKDHEVVFENAFKKGDLVIKKTFADGTTGSLAGWTFDVYEGDTVAADKLVDTVVTDAEGKFNLSLKPGTYTVMEQLPADSKYYCSSQNPQTVDVVYNAEVTVTFENTFKDGTVQIVKKLENGTTAPLSGWTFQIYEGSTVAANKLLHTVTTDANGMIAKDLFPGTYTVLEVLDADSDYEVVGENPVTVTVEAAETATVTFTNRVKDGSLTIRKTFSAGTTGSLAGWTFEIYKGSAVAADKLVDTVTTGSDGKFNITLDPGEYTVREVLPSDSDFFCVSVNPQTVTVLPDSDTEVVFENAFKAGGVKIVKSLTNGTTGSVAGWTFKIYSGSTMAADKLIATVQSGADGTIFHELQPGTYTIYEDIPAGSDYFCASVNPQTITVAPNEVAEVTFENTFHNGTVKIVKGFAEGTTGSLAGWTFNIYSGSTVNEAALVKTVTTGADGTIATALFPGAYTVLEVIDPDSDYECTSDNPVTVTISPNKTQEVRFTNRIKNGHLTIQKVLENGTTGTLAGWQFQIYKGNNTSGTLVATKTTDSKGQIKVDLAPGTYTVYEVIPADSDYECTSPNPQTITVTPDGNHTVSFTNRFKNGHLTIQKVLEDGTTGTLAGWQFKIFKGNNTSGTLVATKTTDSKGQIAVDLAPGTYTVFEVIPEGSEYKCTSPNPVTVTITPDGNHTVSFTNAFKAGGLTIRKVLAAGTTAPLDGWVFKIYEGSTVAANKLLHTVTTNAGGIIDVDLAPGTYTILEDLPQDSDYEVVGNNPVTITVEANESYEVTFTNRIKDGHLTIRKELEAGTTTSLAGWTFNIYEGTSTSGKLVATKTTDTTGIIAVDLAPGTYTVLEVLDTDSDYEVVGNNPVTITVTPDGDHTVTFTNRIKDGSLKIIKALADGTTGTLSGWTFNVYKGGNTSGELVATKTTNAKGEIDLVLAPGTYTVLEVLDADSDYYCTTKNPVTIEVKPGGVHTVTFTNAWKDGNLTIRKTLTSGTEGTLEGWQFNIYSGSAVDSSKLVKTVYTDKNGYIDVALFPGDYTIYEVIPDGSNYHCVTENPVKITIAPNKDHTVTFTNAYNSVGLTIRKTLGNGTEGSLAGWKFNVYQGASTADKDLLQTVTTDSNGYFLMDLAPGTYTVLEILDSDSEYFCSSTNPQTVTVLPGSNATVVFENTWKDGHLTIRKSFASGTTGDLSGWTFAVYQGTEIDESKLHGTYITDSTGMIAADLFPGVYTIYEVLDANSDYKCMSDNPVTITVEPNKDHTVTFTNQFKDGHLTIQKVLENGTTGTLEGWTFQIYKGNNTSGTLVATKTTDAKGQIKVDLAPGTYTVFEVLDANSDYYCTSPNPVTITVTPDGNHTVTFTNRFKDGHLTIQKVLEDGTTGSLADWTFQIFKGSNTSGELVKTVTTDATGIIAVDLAPGTYTVFEVIPSGSAYKCVTKNPVTVTITPNGDHTVSFTNAFKEAGVTIRKVLAADTTGTLEGWVFNIYEGTAVAADKLIDTVTTNASGLIDVDLAPGVYTFYEVLPANSIYEVVGKNPVTVTVEANKSYEVTFTNAFKDGHLTIQKVLENGTTGTLEGWTFDIYKGNNTSGELVATKTTDSKGQIAVDLAPGTYTVFERLPADSDYECVSQNAVTITIEPNGNHTVSFTNRFKNGHLTIQKVLENGTTGTLEGWTFDIYKGNSTSGELVATKTTDSKGQIKVDLAPGTYTVYEVIPADSDYECTSPNPQTITVTPDGNHTVSFTNRFKNGHLTIQKVLENGTTGTLAGWQFQIYKGNNTSGTLVATKTTDSKGQIKVDLAPGTYTVFEVIPEGSEYKCTSPNPVTVTVTPNGNHAVSFTNAFKDGGLTIRKTLAQGTTGTLEGWSFNIYEGSAVAADKLIKTVTTNAGGYIDVDLAPGTYTIFELIDSDSDYKCITENPVTITIAPNQDYEVTFTNQFKAGNLTIIKTLADGTTGTKEGWTFNIYEGGTVSGQLVNTVKTGANGQVSIDLAPGTYTVLEVLDADSDYYCTSPNPVTVTIQPNRSHEVTFTNAYKNGELTIIKTLAEDTTGTLEGWKFNIYKGTEMTESALYDTVVTGKDGSITTTLFPGVYTIFEVIPADSDYYCTTSNPVTVTVVPNGDHTVSFENRFKNGTAKIIKTLAEDTTGTLEGWTFEVYEGSEVAADKLVTTVVTDERGTISVDLFPGTYTIFEKLAEDSIYYPVGENPVTVTVAANKTVEVPFVNKFKESGLTIRKTLAENVEGTLAGWSFGIYAGDTVSDDALVGTYVTDEHGFITEDLEPGTYTVFEMIAEDSIYKCNSENPVTVTMEPNGSYDVAFENTYKDGSLTIIKELAEGTEGTVAGWNFEIYSGPVIDPEKLYTTAVTDELGQFNVSLFPGEYTIFEVLPEDSDYEVVGDNPVTVTVDPVGEHTVTFVNAINKGALNIVKALAEGSEGTLDGWTFEVYQGEVVAPEFLVHTAVTDETGTILAELEPGVYTVLEVLAEDSYYYCTDEENPRIVTVEPGSEGTEVLFTNALKPGSITINKVDAAGEPLAGAKFLLEWSADEGITWAPVTYTESEFVQPGTCTSENLEEGVLTVDETGIVVFSGLYPLHQYRLTEIQAPEGYALLADHAFVGLLPIETQLNLTLTVVNHMNYQLPATGSYDILLPVFGIMIILLTTAMAVCYAPALSVEILAISTPHAMHKAAKAARKRYRS